MLNGLCQHSYVKAPSLLIGGGVDLAKSLDLLGDIAPEHDAGVLMEGHVVVAGKSAEVSEMIDNLVHAVSNTFNGLMPLKAVAFSDYNMSRIYVITLILLDEL